MKYDFELDMVYNNSLSIIARQIRRKSIILEFGPANGRLTRYLKEQLDCKVYLVEIDKEAGHEALQYAEHLLVDDIENLNWIKEYSKVKFDYAIFADVLEHLRDPLTVLRSLKSVLKEDGRVLLSVPNISHNSVLINLLNNRFEYTEIGLLDSTHIHFFTKFSLEKMILEAGFYPVKKMATYNEVGNNEILNNYSDVEGIDESFWKMRDYGSVYQYVYEMVMSPEYIDEQFNYIVKVFPAYFIKFYFDRGQGVSEDDCVQYKIEALRERLTYTLNIDINVKRIKILIANRNCIIEDVSAQIVGDDENIEMMYSSSNLDALEGGQYYFFSDVPELSFEIPPQSLKKKLFQFTIRFVTLDRKEINLLYNTMIRVKQQYGNNEVTQ